MIDHGVQCHVAGIDTDRTRRPNQWPRAASAVATIAGLDLFEYFRRIDGLPTLAKFLRPTAGPDLRRSVEIELYRRIGKDN